ncbi:glycosyltransferase family 4 protein [Flavobacterium sp.]|jgi:glycosyltransferase involved in cell wall biosynthesis|uniref:glycosyltransferase family 4 protein n=1 Tax=Flavobacterium sp. TaxID=239 RepID=UPI0037C05A2B
MNILLLHQYYLEEDDHGGSRWNEITKQWVENGHHVQVIAGMMHYTSSEKRVEYKGKWFKKKRQGSIDVMRCHVSETYNSNFIGRLWAYFSFVFSSLWAGLFKVEGKYDVIIVTSPPLFIGISGYIISLFKRTPYVFEIRDLWPESAIDTGVVTNKFIIKLAYALEKFIYKKAILINVLTPAFRDNLIHKKGITEDKIIFIPNAADFSLSDDLVQNFDVKEFKVGNDLNNKFVITYVGAHGLANHLDQVLDTAHLLKDTNVLFLLIGDGMEKPRLIRKAKDENIQNVRFINPVPKADVFKYILASDMGTSVLKNVETFKTVYSNKTFDYMACKKPILMAIDGVSRDLVEQADAGIFVQPENSQDFAQKIMQYLSNPSEINIQGENGYRFAKENFDRMVLANKYLNLIQKSLK